jgi:hypothetical protein
VTYSSNTLSANELIPFLHGLVSAYKAGALGSTTHEIHPGLTRESRENFLYFTLAPAVNFQRNSEALWRAAASTYRDPETRFVFFPEESARPESEYREALMKYALASFTQKHTRIWYTISQTLAQNYNADPRVLVAMCDSDAELIRAELISRRRDFPYLSGPKLANYWLYMLTCFTDVQIKDRKAITIIPDVHVIRASVRLGVIQEHTTNRVAVAEAWEAALQNTPFAPVDLHAPLWRWSRMGFPSINL